MQARGNGGAAHPKLSFPLCDLNQEHSELGGQELFKALPGVSLAPFFSLDVISGPATKHWEKNKRK